MFLIIVYTSFHPPLSPPKKKKNKILFSLDHCLNNTKIFMPLSSYLMKTQVLNQSEVNLLVLELEVEKNGFLQINKLQKYIRTNSYYASERQVNYIE